MTSRYSFSLCCLVFILTVIGPSFSQKKMCSKIFFQNIDENVNPWVQVEGVYELFSNNDGFPVYLNNPSGLFFYYTAPGAKFFAFGPKITEVFGLVGSTRDDFNPQTWLSTGTLNKNDVFSDVIKEWIYYSPLDKKFKSLQGPPFMKAICVDDEYSRCDSGKVYLNDTITGSKTEVLNDPRVDYFARLPGVYETIRPVFKHNRQNWYLYYHNDYWRIGSSYSSSSGEVLRVKDSALRPEYVTSYWEIWTGTGWTTERGLRIKCRGFANGENKCHDSAACNHEGTCVYTSENETVCLCQDSRYGLQCENRDGCSDPGVPESSVSVVQSGKRPGDIATSFCKAGYKSLPMEFYVCEQNSGSKSWLRESVGSCRVPEPTTINPGPPGPPVTPRPRPYPSDNQVPDGDEPADHNSESFMIFVIAFFACHIIVPVFIWLGIVITKIVRSYNTTQLGTPERVAAVSKAGDGRYMLMVRVFSAFFNLTFWVWLCAVCVCASTSDGEPCSPLFYWPVAMCGVCTVFVIIEGFFSCERAALRHLVSWEYIRSLQGAPPGILMEVEWYDLMRFREAVYRTDPVTGRQTYDRTVEREVKVNRKTVRQPFVYSSWTDQSHLVISEDGMPVRLEIHIDVTLEGEAVPVFEAQKRAFIEKTSQLNRQHHDFTRKDSVPNHQPHVVLCPNNTVPFWLNELFFWCATFLQLSWPYRWFFVSQTSSADFTLKKQVFCNPVSYTSYTQFQQDYPDLAAGHFKNAPPQVPSMPSGLGADDPPQVPSMPSDQHSDDPNKPLISGQHTNYMTV